ncbi:hypothetical protein [Thioalkalivibrio sp.]|nr:hypothetical protein [Thioalkalivibrio sp.]
MTLELLSLLPQRRHGPPLRGSVQIDEAYLGGERSGGKAWT